MSTLKVKLKKLFKHTAVRLCYSKEQVFKLLSILKGNWYFDLSSQVKNPGGMETKMFHFSGTKFFNEKNLEKNKRAQFRFWMTETSNKISLMLLFYQQLFKLTEHRYKGLF